jgi:hypothetical protein
VPQAHAAKKNDIGIGLKPHSGKHFIVWFPGNGEDGKFLGFHQGIEHIDHWDTGADHLIGTASFDRIYSRRSDIDPLADDLRPVVSRRPRTVKHAADHGLAERDLHGTAEEPNAITI